jgi:formate hydrogenlyase subunit 3/multisubunit Na+/H+ antiporter MnhD subunit
MIYFLLAFFPIALAGTCFVLRKRTALVSLAALLAVLVEALLVYSTPVDLPARMLGIDLTLVSLNRIFLLGFCVALAVAFLAAVQLPHGENFPSIALLSLGLVATIMLIQDPFVITLLLLASGLAVVLAVVDMPVERSGLVTATSIDAALRYLVLMLLAGLVLALGFVLVDTRLRGGGDVTGSVTSSKLTLSLLLIGFGLRLGLVPFHNWLPDLLEEAAPLVSLLVVGVINVTALLFLVLLFQYIPETLQLNESGPQQVRIFALVTVVVAALLLLRQRSLRRFVAFLLIYDTGIMLMGTVSNRTGLTGTLFEALNQVLFGLLLFLSLAMLEQPEARPAPPGEGLLRRKPVASTSFIAASLALLGVPPFSGFASKALLYQGIASHGWGYLAAVLVATALCGYALAVLLKEQFLSRVIEIKQVEEGPEVRDLELPPLPELRREPRLLAGVAIGLMVFAIVLGVYPQPLLQQIVETVQGLTYVQGL